MEHSKRVNLQTEKTEKGVKYCTFGLGIFVLWQFLWIMILFSMSEALPSILNVSSNGTESEAIESIVDYFLPLCGGLLLLIIALILITIGIFYIYLGRLEFGQVHAGNVQVGITFLILGFIISVSLSAIPISIRWSGNIATGVLYSLGVIYLLKEVIDKRHLRFIILAGVIFIIIGIINSLSIVLINWSGSDLLDSSENAILLALSFLSFNIIPWAIVTLAFLNAWKGIERQTLESIIHLKTDTIDQVSGMLYPPTIISNSQGQPTACPSCGYRLTGTELECPECGYYFDD